MGLSAPPFLASLPQISQHLDPTSWLFNFARTSIEVVDVAVWNRWRGSHGGLIECKEVIDEWIFHGLAAIDYSADTLTLSPPNLDK